MQEVFSKIIEELEELHERYVNQYGVVGGNPMAFAVRECIDIVEEIVKQEAEKFDTGTNVGSNGWIPCSERLPKYGEVVMCSCTNSGITISCITHKGVKPSKSVRFGQHSVIAWQPLPQPYTKGE